MKNLFNLLLLICFVNTSIAQQRINGSFEFQTDPDKMYSIYIPSGYNQATPNKLMLGLHPLNPANWDGSIWCDTLVAFAEANQLLLICPDGGTDGAIDDPIDLAFTSVLLDSMEHWYNVDTSKVYAMGFSWGGKTTYTYGLNNIPRLKGFIPIGAAINGASEVSSTIQNSTGRPFYLVHGANDSPNSRFYPLLQALEDNDALTNSLLMSGVGHTINFPNRNQILNTAFHWVDSVNCSSIPTSIEDHLFATSSFLVVPNPIDASTGIQITISDLPISGIFNFQLIDQAGRKINQWSKELSTGQNQIELTMTKGTLSHGIYFLQLYYEKEIIRNMKILIGQ